MHKEKLHIEFPSEIEIQMEIQTIIDFGITEKEPFYTYLIRMYKQLGFRFLFRDLTEIVFAILLVASVLMFTGFYINQNLLDEIGRMYSFVFIVSPILYLVVSILFFINAKNRDTYQVEMTCKYNIYQLASFRMLVFSLACMGVNGILIYFLTLMNQQLNFFFAFLISITSLFLFSTIFLLLNTRVQSLFVKYAFFIGWVLFNSVLAVYSSEFYYAILRDTPIYAYVVITIGCTWMYVKNLKNLIVYRGTEGLI